MKKAPTDVSLTEIKPNQKILNWAFVATLAMTGISLLGFFAGNISLTWLAIVETVLFLTFGFFTMKGNKKAATALLVLFIIDRVIWIFNWGSVVTQTQAIPAFCISLVLWFCFYRAYLVIKNNSIKKIKKNKITSKKIILFLIFGLLGFLLIKKKLSYQNITKALHSLDTENYVEVVTHLNGNKKRDLLKIHSKETSKVIEYSLLDNISEEQVYNHFVNKGWKDYAVGDAIIWNINKAYYIVLSDENVPEEEIFETFKEVSSWTDQYSKVLLEEISLDNGQ